MQKAFAPFSEIFGIGITCCQSNICVSGKLVLLNFYVFYRQILVSFKCLYRISVQGSDRKSATILSWAFSSLIPKPIKCKEWGLVVTIVMLASGIFLKLYEVHPLHLEKISSSKVWLSKTDFRLHQTVLLWIFVVLSQIFLPIDKVSQILAFIIFRFTEHLLQCFIYNW